MIIVVVVDDDVDDVYPFPKSLLFYQREVEGTPKKDTSSPLSFVIANKQKFSTSSSNEYIKTVPLITYKITSQDGRPMPKNIQGWYRGVVANASAVAPITAFQMAVNGGLERLILAGDASRELRAHEKIGAAMGAGAISSILYSPLDLVVIQQQKLATSIG